MKKRVLSLILALVLCVGLLPMAASAYNKDRELIDSLLPDNPGTPVLTDVNLIDPIFWYRSERPWHFSKSQEDYLSELEELVNDLTRGKDSETAKARAIFDWAAKNIDYDHVALKTTDTHVGYTRGNAICTFAGRKGVCEGYARLTTLMNIIAGIPTAYVEGKAKNTGNHAWTAVYVDGDWLYYDATWNRWDIGLYYHDSLDYARVYGQLCYRTNDNMLWVSEQRGFKFPEAGIPRNVTRIESDAFYNCQDIEHVVIPNTVVRCGERIFRDCKNLKTIEFEEGCNPEMGKAAFDQTSGLETVIIPGSLKELGDHMFEDCHKLKNVIIGDGVETIKDHAFDGCDGLESISFPSSVKTIEDNVFYLCKSLKSIYVPSSVTSIGKDAFLTYSTNGTTIYTEPGSYAETYAKENKIKVITDAAPPVSGLNGDTTGRTGAPVIDDMAQRQAVSASRWAQPEVAAAIRVGVVPDTLRNSYSGVISRSGFCALMVKLIETVACEKIYDYVVYTQGKDFFAAPFTDTEAREVRAAYALGIVNGVSETEFKPYGSITRQEAAAMLERTAKLLGITDSGSGVSFSDSGSIASWAAGSVAFVSGLTDPVNGNKVMGGVGNGNFGPTGTYTREQAIATTLRLFHCAA